VSEAAAEWRSRATRAVLVRRAALLAKARAFFAARGVLEVDTPLVVNSAVTDVHIESAAVQLGGAAGVRYLHTSPEYAMKRLLAGGSGDIYQICHVVRGFEVSRLHNPEFTLIEWYRTSLPCAALMQELEALVRELLEARARGRASEQLSYRDAFLRELALDPLEASLTELAHAAARAGYRSGGTAERDELLEFLMATLIGPKLGRDALTFIHGYPASQAALARLDPRDPRTALRFELYCEGVELANGFEELTSHAEQRARFERDREERSRLGLPVPAVDERLLAALAAGLPACSGVALGFDRVLMLALGVSRIDEVLSFPQETA